MVIIIIAEIHLLLLL